MINDILTLSPSPQGGTGKATTTASATLFRPVVEGEGAPDQATALPPGPEAPGLPDVPDLPKAGHGARAGAAAMRAELGLAPADDSAGDRSPEGGPSDPLIGLSPLPTVPQTLPATATETDPGAPADLSPDADVLTASAPDLPADTAPISAEPEIAPTAPADPQPRSLPIIGTDQKGPAPEPQSEIEATGDSHPQPAPGPVAAKAATPPKPAAAPEQADRSAPSPDPLPDAVADPGPSAEALPPPGAVGRKSVATVPPRAEPSALQRNLLDRLSEVNLEEGRSRFLLRPRGLGVVEIDLTRLLDGRMQVVLRLENPLVLEGLRAEAGQLGAWLEERGFDLGGDTPEFAPWEAPEAPGEGATETAPEAAAAPETATGSVLSADGRLNLLT